MVIEYNHGAPGASFQRKKSQPNIKARRNGTLQKTSAQLGNKRAEFWKGLPSQGVGGAAVGTSRWVRQGRPQANRAQGRADGLIG